MKYIKSILLLISISNSIFFILGKAISNKTEVYKATGIKTIPYAFLLTDTNRVIGVELNENGDVIYKSTLLLDEEEEILELSNELKEANIKYQKYDTNLSMINTREEEFIIKVLLQDIKSAYLQKDYYKLKYLYSEIYDDKEKNIEIIYDRLINDIKNDFSNKHKELFNILIKSGDYL